MEEQHIQLQEEVKQYVRSTGRWYNFFAILSIVGIAFMVPTALLFFVAGGFMSEAMAEAGQPFPAWVLGVIYLASAALMVPIVIYLMRASKDAKSAVELNSSEAAVRFLRNTKSFWKFYGILTIVVIALCIIAVPIAVTIGVAAAL